MNDGAAVLHIDHDKDTGQKNKAIFDALYAQKDQIKQEFGGPLKWRRMDDKRSSHIEKTITAGGLVNPDTWPELQDQMIDAMIRLHKALSPRLATVRI